MKGVTVWFTGLPCSGKTTLALKLNEELRRRGYHPEALDGDVTRKYLSKGLGFSKEDRDENIRRVGFVCSLLTRHGAVTTAAFVSPYRSIRREIRQLIGNFVEVYVQCPVNVCRQRDIKGMYRKAQAGEIQNFTGVSDPYEEPEHAEVVVATDRESEEQSLAKIVTRLEALGFIDKRSDEICLPEYLKKEAQPLLDSRRFPDWQTLIIHLLNEFLSPQRQAPALSGDEENEIREKLKKMGYLS